MDPAIAIAAQTQRRREQNRLAAVASRIKRQQHIAELELRVQQLSADNQRLTDQLQHTLQPQPHSQPLVTLANVVPPLQHDQFGTEPEAVRSSPADESAHVSVVPLSRYPRHVDATAALLYAEWANLYAHENVHSVQQLAHKLRTDNPPQPSTIAAPTAAQASHSPPPLPTTLIALTNNGRTLIGTASLDTHDLPVTHPYQPVTPWVSSVLVSERWRGKGVAGRLVRGVEAEARRRGLEWLWLWTVKPASVAMYAHLGWRVIERVWMAEKAKHITVMRKDLVDHSEPPTTSSTSAPSSIPLPPLSAPSQPLYRPQPQPPSQPVFDMARVYERLEGMIGSLREFEDISAFAQVAAEYAKERLSVLENEQHTRWGQTELDGRRQVRGGRGGGGGGEDERDEEMEDEDMSVFERVAAQFAEAGLAVVEPEKNEQKNMKRDEEEATDHQLSDSSLH